MRAARSKTGGYTFVELLMVIAIVSILAAIILPRFEPSIDDELVSTAQIVAADLAYARSLAVTNGSVYRWTFDLTQNRYTLDHNGANPLLETLPASPFRRAGDPPDRQTADLDEIPHSGPTATLVAVQTTATAGAVQAVTDVEFGPLGGTTRATPTVIWLASGSGDNRRFLPVTVDPITGLVAVGDLQATDPPQAASTSSSTGS